MTDSEKKEATLEGGTYEIIRGRLENQTQELRTRLDKLNETRKATFGAIVFVGTLICEMSSRDWPHLS